MIRADREIPYLLGGATARLEKHGETKMKKKNHARCYSREQECVHITRFYLDNLRRYGGLWNDMKPELTRLRKVEEAARVALAQFVGVDSARAAAYVLRDALEGKVAS